MSRAKRIPGPMEMLTPGRCGVAEITYVEVSRLDEMRSAMHGGLNYCPAGTYMRLLVRKELVMSNTPMEEHTNWEVQRKANGKVLIAGLGLGLILNPILYKQEVESVLVVEKEPDVIALVAEHYAHPKLTVIQGDILQWSPRRGELFDTLYFDIWNKMSTDNLPEMAALHQRFKYYKNRSNPNAWMGSWCQSYLRSEKRSDSRYRFY